MDKAYLLTGIRGVFCLVLNLKNLYFLGYWYLSEQLVLAEVADCKSCFAPDIDLTEQGFSNMERDVYEILIVGV